MSGFEDYLERESTNHLACGIEKSPTRAVAAAWLQAVCLRMKTNSSPTTIFVSEKMWKCTQRINAFLNLGGDESKAKGISVTDLVTESAFSKG